MKHEAIEQRELVPVTPADVFACLQADHWLADMATPSLDARHGSLMAMAGNCIRHGQRLAADQLSSLEAERDALAKRVGELEAALEWYGEQARLCRLIHSEGDTGRHALQADGGSRARAALNTDPSHAE